MHSDVVGESPARLVEQLLRLSQPEVRVGGRSHARDHVSRERALEPHLRRGQRDVCPQLIRGGEHVGIVGQTGDAFWREHTRPERHREQDHKDAEEHERRHHSPLQAALDLGDGELGYVGGMGFGHARTLRPHPLGSQALEPSRRNPYLMLPGAGVALARAESPSSK